MLIENNKQNHGLTHDAQIFVQRTFRSTTKDSTARCEKENKEWEEKFFQKRYNRHSSNSNSVNSINAAPILPHKSYLSTYVRTDYWGIEPFLQLNKPSFANVRFHQKEFQLWVERAKDGFVDSHDEEIYHPETKSYGPWTESTKTKEEASNQKKVEWWMEY